MIKVLYSGVSRTSSNRVWGYLVDTIEDVYCWRSQYYTFWGHNGGKIHFQQTAHTPSFYKMRTKKIKKYEPVKMDEHILNEFDQVRVIKKLKGI